MYDAAGGSDAPALNPTPPKSRNGETQALIQWLPRLQNGKGTMTRRFGQFVCCTGNIGDDLQSLAARQHLPRPPTVSVNRDKVHRYFGHPIALIMNGWFSSNVEAWPPSPSIYPVFVGFHICDRLKPAVARHTRYLKFFEPIGSEMQRPPISFNPLA
jgi:hypothetical protein